MQMDEESFSFGEPRPNGDRVHYVGYSSQPDIQFFCDDTWDTPSWNQIPEGAEGYEEGVYLASEGRLYTFEPRLTSCHMCAYKLGLVYGAALLDPLKFQRRRLIKVLNRRASDVGKALVQQFVTDLTEFMIKEGAFRDKQ